jgi:D-3-phosphoglycerate dehydrogenase
VTAIYISDAIHEDVLANIRQNASVHLGYGPEKVNYTDISDIIDAVILRAETFTRDMIEASPRLRIIARHGVGTDNVDLAAASENGVWVTSTPGSNSNAVAEHVFALLLSLTRQVVPGRQPGPGRDLGGRPGRPGRLRTLPPHAGDRRVRRHR